MHCCSDQGILARMDETVKLAVKEIQKRVMESALEVATPQFMRAYWRGNPHRLVEFASKTIPQVVEGAGEGGEHVFKIVHAIKQSQLDGPPHTPALPLEGEFVSE